MHYATLARNGVPGAQAQVGRVQEVVDALVVDLQERDLDGDRVSGHGARGLDLPEEVRHRAQHDAAPGALELLLARPPRRRPGGGHLAAAVPRGKKGGIEGRARHFKRNAVLERLKVCSECWKGCVG